MSGSTPQTLSDYDLLRYLQCPHWLYWELFADPALKKSGMEGRELMIRGNLLKEEKILDKLYKRRSVTSIYGQDEAKRIEATERQMHSGSSIIYHGCLSVDGLVGHPTVLVRTELPSQLGPWSYYPMIVKRRHVLRKEDHLQLGWQAYLLERLQGVCPTEAFIVSPDAECVPSDPREAQLEVKGIIEELKRIQHGECPEPTLRKACLDTSPWGVCCLELAERTQDIALLFQVNRKQRTALRDIGILNVEQAATMDPSQLSGQDPRLTLKSLQSIQRQARSLQEHTVIVRESFVRPAPTLEIHFDIESYPATDTDYLFGCLVRDRSEGVEHYLPFAAKALMSEKRMWQKFLAWTDTLPEDYIVYHYSLYEQERLEVLAKRYGTQEHAGLQRFQERMVDVNEIVKDHVVFPLYVYSLKNVGGLIGATWNGEVTHGADSVDVFARWLELRRTSDWRALVSYNEDDVRATARVIDWLTKYATKEMSYQAPFPWQPEIS